MLFKGKEKMPENEKRIVDTIRCLGIDMIKEANSGHPGITLDAAPILYTLYAKHMKINPKDPTWFNRDRFVMSAGHGSALLYATLLMAGYEITLDDLKNFRKLNSITPGHPEYGVTPGVDISTGPLGQGLAASVGMAIAEEYLRNYYLKKGMSLIDYHTYVLCSDGDLMEGVSYEAISLAGTLKLSHLIVIYDCNHMSLDGTTNHTFTENIPQRFEAMNWNVLSVADGEDLTSLDGAISKAKTSTDKPTLIVVNTTIGKYSKLQGTKEVHGTPLTDDDISAIKQQFEMRDIPFAVSQDVIDDMQEMIHERNDSNYLNSMMVREVLDEEDNADFENLTRSFSTVSLDNVDYEMPEEDGEALRISGGKILNLFASASPFFMGGSADVSSSTKTYLDNQDDFSSINRLGKNIWFGVREHAMGAILNGMCLSGLRVFGSTFLSFSDYMKPAIRMSALMKLPVTYIFTHDSISIGEDGPTHQPVEQLISLRSIPNVEVFRPCDVNEIIGIYQYAMSKTDGPTIITLGRNLVKFKKHTSIKEVTNGAYIIKREDINLNGILVASGEEVDIALEVAKRLEEKGLSLRVVSMASIEKFKKQSKEYQEQLLPLGSKVFVIEAASSYSWNSFVYNDKYLITVDEFGQSGNKDEVYTKFGFDVEIITEKIISLLK